MAKVTRILIAVSILFLTLSSITVSTGGLGWAQSTNPPPSQLELQKMELRALVAEIQNLRIQLQAKTDRAQQLQVSIQETIAKPDLTPNPNAEK